MVPRAEHGTRSTRHVQLSSDAGDFLLIAIHYCHLPPYFCHLYGQYFTSIVKLAGVKQESLALDEERTTSNDFNELEQYKIGTRHDP